MIKGNDMPGHVNGWVGEAKAECGCGICVEVRRTRAELMTRQARVPFRPLTTDELQWLAEQNQAQIEDALRGPGRAYQGPKTPPEDVAPPYAGLASAPAITGYRQLSVEEIELINRIKAAGEQLGYLVDQVFAARNVDQRWVSIARTDLQTGLMALTRAVARPTSF